MAKKTKEHFKIEDFPLLKSATSGVSSFDYKLLDMYYIEENVKHTLRNYQRSALYHLDWSQKNDKSLHNQLMFNMATGSGKTDVMAATILYFYKEFKYTNFLFTSNSTAIISKTRENFLNPSSSKYLFSRPINIDGEKIDIRPVNNFPLNQEPNTIYLKLATIQTLSREIDFPKENSLTYYDLKNYKLIILADEAHHYNSLTKDERKKDGKKKESSWEDILDRIRNANKQNKQLEFTATIDVDKQEVYKKYKDKIIYKYDLDHFMKDGYSKTVFRLQANNDNRQKLLNAVLLSQYRKRIAKKMRINNFKPVILVKSNRKNTSMMIKDQFIDMIANLSSGSLESFIKKNQKINEKSQALSLTYKYWLTQDVSKTVKELKQDFNVNTIINVNENVNEGILSDDNNFKRLNSLEDFNNPIRIIFAVAKLTEGWDVLNLYDIVRITEEKESTSIKQTNSEAQLIGRGARYYPFIYRDKKSYIRRFDNSKDKEKKLLETLYYHTINNSRYISNLNKSFDKIDLIVNEDDQYNVYTAKVKNSFKNTMFYKHGNLFYNKTVEVPDSKYKSIGDYGIGNMTMIIDYNLSTTETDLRDDYYAISEADTRYDEVANFSNQEDYRLIKKALSRNKFYRFSVVKKYIPMLKSIKEFTTSKNWLGNLKVKARVPNQYNMPLKPNEKILVLDTALTRIENDIIKNYRKERGTNNFIPIAVRDAIKDYSKVVPTVINQTLSEHIIPKSMKREDWFPYDFAITDDLETSLINLVGSWIEDLKDNYDDIYLIRNEEVATNWSLHEFENIDIKHYSGYMPDFILVLNNGQVMYQVYIEPKGDQLLEQDQWKEDLLESIRPENVNVFTENENVKLYGVRFYTKRDGRNIEGELEDLKILKEKYHDIRIFPYNKS